MSARWLLRDRTCAIAAEAWPAYRDAYLARAAAVARRPEGIQAELPMPVTGDGIAVVPIQGVLTRRGDDLTALLGWPTYDGIVTQLDALARDRSVARIVLRVDSPGGTVFGVEEAAQAVADAAKRKPVLAIADGLMASAAYWVASGATRIVAVPGAEIGSIGVIAVHMDESGALAQEGIVATEITMGAHKGEGSPYRPLSDDDRAALQTRVEAQYQLFTARVARGRKVPVESVRVGFGEGRVLPATDALRAGLIDGVARWADLVESTREELRTHTSRLSALDTDLRLRARLLALCG